MRRRAHQWLFVLAGFVGAGGCASSKGGPSSPPLQAATLPEPPRLPPEPLPRGRAEDDPSARGAQLIARALRRVEAARGLRSTKPVPGVLLDRRALIARVKEHVARELPPEAIREEGLELQLFGLLPARFDYEAAEYQLLQDQLAGYYEPADATMYLANDLGDKEAGATLAHELVHALQDQRWNLEERSRYRPGEGDRSEAVSALAEGDATSAMYDVMIAEADPDTRKTAVDIPDAVFAENIRSSMSEGPGATAPAIMRSSLSAPYIYGILFVHQLRRRGGWAAVNAAWDDAPTTTEQLLHIDKWLSREPAARVPAPSFATLGAGWTVSDEETEGELGARLAFEEWMGPSSAAAASENWGGDRGILVTQGDLAAFGWSLHYDAKHDETARKAFDGVRKALERLLGKANLSENQFVCHERQDRGPIAVERSVSMLVFALGPATVVQGKDWSSAGTCALSRRWTREILAAERRGMRNTP